MHNPPHPGDVLRDGVFADTGITVTEFAKRLGVTRAALSRVLKRAAAKIEPLKRAAREWRHRYAALHR